MSKNKKTIKVRDLKPNKDAKGGGHFQAGHQQAGHQQAGHQQAGSHGFSGR